MEKLDLAKSTPAKVAEFVYRRYSEAYDEIARELTSRPAAGLEGDARHRVVHELAMLATEVYFLRGRAT